MHVSVDSSGSVCESIVVHSTDGSSLPVALGHVILRRKKGINIGEEVRIGRIETNDDGFMKCLDRFLVSLELGRFPLCRWTSLR